jgi:Rieske Fe-S protein
MDAEYVAQMTSDDGRPPHDNAFSEGDETVSELESAEQYVRTHELIESMRAERRPVRDGGTDDDARLSATAAMLHAANSESGAVDPLFAARLFARLESAQAALANETAQTEERARPSTEAAAIPSAPQADHSTPIKRAGLTRRRALLGGLGAAAAALSGAAVTAALEQAGKQPTNIPLPTGSLVLPGTGTWVAIAALDSMPIGAVKRFEAGAVIGYVQHTASGFLALSGVCTHMACLLQWNGADMTFDCPCHGGRFLSSGKAAPGGRYTYPPLPAIQTKVESDQVWVYVTGGAASDEFPQPQATVSNPRYGASVTGPDTTPDK